MPRKKSQKSPRAVDQNSDHRLKDSSENTIKYLKAASRPKNKRPRHSDQDGGEDSRWTHSSWMKLAFVLGVLAVVGYNLLYTWMCDTVRTPLSAPKMINTGPGPNRDDMERFWGSYRSHLYFGLKTRSPHSPVVGLMWMPQIDTHGGVPPIRHWCDQGDRLPSYGWSAHDGVNFGIQEIVDYHHVLKTSFVKRPGGSHGGDWSARITIHPREGTAALPVSLFFYMALDRDGQLVPDIVSNHGRLSSISGWFPSLGNFTLRFPEVTKSSAPIRYNYLVGYTPSLDRVQETVSRAFQSMTVSRSSGNLQYIALAGKSLPNDMDDSKANLIVSQITSMAPFEMEIAFESGSAVNQRLDSLLGDVYEKELLLHDEYFRSRFDSTFVLDGHGFDADQVAFGRATLSNMLGSIGYFYGSSSVKSQYTTHPVEYWPAPLLTAVPSRSFFPRGFLWDEGFHELLISRWDEQLSRDIIGHWLDLINEEGWIPREQILGPEARARVPAEFIVQFNENANPPALFLPLRRIINHLIGTNEPRDRQYLRLLYPRLKVWYNWFNRTQSGAIPSSYRWRGRNATTSLELNPKTLTSGLDDYPRASHPTEDERHVDLRCWMAFASGVMGDLARALNESSARNYDEVHARLMDNELLDELHWSEKMHRYSDYGLHTDSVKLVRPKSPPPPHPVVQMPPAEKQRAVKRDPVLGFVDSSFGYVSLFPFLLHVLKPDSPRLTQILADLRKPELLWTPYGLRSLAKSSPMYGKHNTEHDPPYWRGAIWININYLALSALHHYSNTNGVNSAVAAEIYKDLRSNIINNIYSQYKRTGYVWEQYDDVTGSGKGSHPFTGWSALVVSIMAEDYF